MANIKSFNLYYQTIFTTVKVIEKIPVMATVKITVTDTDTVKVTLVHKDPEHMWVMGYFIARPNRSRPTGGF